MPKKHLFLLAILSLISLVNLYAQFGYSSELGIVFGPTSFQSDFGSREDTKLTLEIQVLELALFTILIYPYHQDVIVTPETPILMIT